SLGDILYRDLTDAVFYAPGKWSMKMCPNPVCGLLWLDPMPVAEDLPAAYEGYYTHGVETRPALYAGGRFLYRFVMDVALWLTGIPAERRRSELMFIEDVPRGRLLDVGCGYGTFLAAMKRRGWQVAGVDFDPVAAEAARRTYGLDVRVGTIENVKAGGPAYDVITASHVIEHVPDPVSFLSTCRALLKPGGLLVLKTPNADSFGSRRYGPAWRGLEPPRHLHIFTLDALQACARRAGFSVSRCFTSAAAADGILLASRFIERNKSFREAELSVGQKVQSRLLRPTLALLAKLKWLRNRNSGEEICAILLNDAEADR
ncbi:MAG: class I SAM-dependent methyltransferase, partial [Acidobacteriaceae bacterium]